MGGPGPHIGYEEGFGLAWADSSVSRAAMAAVPWLLCGLRTEQETRVRGALCEHGLGFTSNFLAFQKSEIALLLNFGTYMKTC